MYADSESITCVITDRGEGFDVQKEYRYSEAQYEKALEEVTVKGIHRQRGVGLVFEGGRTGVGHGPGDVGPYVCQWIGQ